MAKTRFTDPAVAEIFAAYTPAQRERLLRLRELIFQVAMETAGVGRIEETLRWRQPSYLTNESGSGSTVRIDAVRGSANAYAIYFICTTGLIDDFKELYPKLFKFEGNRAIVFDVAHNLPVDELRHCISLALTYHLRNQSKKNRRK